jgi:hypothetical protein
MTNKYFRRGADDLVYRIIATQDIMGQNVILALQMDKSTADILNDGITQTGWEEVREDSVEIDNFYIDIETDEFGMNIEEDYGYDEEEGYHDNESNHPPNIKPFEPSKLKAMLEGLRHNPFDESRTVGEAADILGLIRSRNRNTTSAEVREFSEKELAALNQSDAEYELLNIDASYMALVRKLG